MPMVTERLTNRPVWFDLSTSDLAAAKALYAELFGWTFGDSPAELGFYTMAFAKGIPAAAVAPKMPGQDAAPAIWTVYFGVTDADATMARITANGGTVMVPPMAIPPDLGRMAIAVDPGGALFGLWEHGSFSGAGIEGEHGSMCWTEVACRNAAENAGFYTAVFGLTSQRLPGDAVEYYILHDGEPGVAGVMQMDAAWEGVPPHWMPYFAVDSLGAANATLTKHGGKILNGPIPSPHGKIMVVRDPQGAVFSYMSGND
jgi:uncharacterized protein